MYTVKQLATLAGVTERTLRYYDQIDLLKPAHYGDNGYRYYDAESLLRLQQILFFRELGLRLKDINRVIHSSDFDALHALRLHRQQLAKRAERIDRLIRTIDRTILHLEGELDMSEGDLFAGFSEEKQKEYEQKARHLWGDDAVARSNQQWKSYSKTEQQAIGERWNAIFGALRDHMDEGPDSPAIQEQIAALHAHVRIFWDCGIDGLRGLGDMYASQPDFVATFRGIHPDLPEFLRDAVYHYCDTHAE